MKIILLGLLVLLSACSQSLLKVKVMRKSHVPPEGFYYRPAGLKPDKTRAHMWAALIFAGNFYSFDEKIKKGVSQLCEGRTYVRDFEITRHFWLIPVLYTEERMIFQGNCHD